MKIAITSRGTKLHDHVDPRFVRAKGFLIYDTDSGNATFIDNSKNGNPSHNGMQSAQKVISYGVKVVLTGHCGPRVFKALTDAGIKIYLGIVTETVKEAIDRFRKGELSAAGEADAGDYW